MSIAKKEKDEKTEGRKSILRSDEEQQEMQKQKDEEEKNMAEARDKATQMILEAEQYRAAINEPPKGRSFNLCDNGLSDGDFFHVTCHIDENLKAKIQNGEFVELEKLLPKVKSRFSEGKMELVNRNGATFFVPTDNQAGKINSIRRWKQAFRVYAAIYSAAHPNQSVEIWQYVHVINTAASSYVWNNVSSYDYTFRQLMAFNPGMNRAKFYTQGWNLCMQDALPKNQNSGRFPTYNNSNRNS